LQWAARPGNTSVVARPRTGCVRCKGRPGDASAKGLVLLINREDREGKSMDQSKKPQTKRQLVSSRRAFLKGAGASLAVAGMASAGVAPGFLRNARAAGELKIVMWSHFVPAYDTWFDKFAQDWGHANGVEVTVAHIPHLEEPARAAAEVAAQSGHDLFHCNGWGGPHLYRNHVEELGDLVKYAEGKYGKVSKTGIGVAYNPDNKTWTGFPDYYIRFPSMYRKDLWDEIGMLPDTWDHVRRGGAKLKAKGHPVGIGLGHSVDPQISYNGILWSFGSSLSDETGTRCALKDHRKESIEAIKYVKALYEEAMTNEVLSWDDASNNLFLQSGKGCWIHNPISAYRSTQKSNPELADKIFVGKTPAGPVRRLVAATPNSWMIWKFGRNKANAHAFLKHYVDHWAEGFTASTAYNHPMFEHLVPNPMPILSNDPTSHPHDKLKVLETANEWEAALGWPGPGNPQSDEILNDFTVVDMMAKAATGKMSPEDALDYGFEQCEKVYKKWKTILG
jgi:multiple sugar transport system substrate-binding protein